MQLKYKILSRKEDIFLICLYRSNFILFFHFPSFQITAVVKLQEIPSISKATVGGYILKWTVLLSDAFMTSHSIESPVLKAVFTMQTLGSPSLVQSNYPSFFVIDYGEQANLYVYLCNC